MTDTQDIPITHLQRRKIEARALVPFIEALREKYGEDAMRGVLDATIRKMAEGDGAQWADTYGRNIAGLKSVVQEVWAGGGGMDVEIIGQSDTHLGTGLEAIPGALLGLGLMWFLGVRQLRAEGRLA